MFYDGILLYGIILNQVLFTQHQALVSDSCKHRFSAESEAMEIVKKLRMEFASYREETQRDFQQLKDQLKNRENWANIRTTRLSCG